MQEASAEHKAGGGKDWDTVKPLNKWFSRLHRLLLVDDDSYKVSHSTGEKSFSHCLIAQPTAGSHMFFSGSTVWLD